MSSKFGVILDIMTEAFKSPVSEEDYYKIVELLRNYIREDPTAEQHELAIRGYPAHYHPCDHMERIRFAMTFGGKDNAVLKDLFSRAV